MRLHSPILSLCHTQPSPSPSPLLTYTHLHPLPQVRATDDDLGTFGELMYALMSGHMGQFNITENSGRVETTDQLDYETTPSYTISIRALDLAENALERK